MYTRNERKADVARRMAKRKNHGKPPPEDGPIDNVPEHEFETEEPVAFTDDGIEFYCPVCARSVGISDPAGPHGFGFDQHHTFNEGTRCHTCNGRL